MRYNQQANQTKSLPSGFYPFSGKRQTIIYIEVNKRWHVRRVIVCRREIEKRKRLRDAKWGGRMWHRPGLNGNVMFDQKIKRREKVSQADIRGRQFPPAGTVSVKALR